MARRVEINDGQAIDLVDLNAIGKLAERVLSHFLWSEAAVAEDGFGTPLLVNGFFPELSGTGNRTVTIGRGVAIQPEFPPSDDDDPFVTIGETAEQVFTLDAPTSGSVYRRDVLQYKLDAEDTTESESRDFEDAATRALSSQTFDTRRVRGVLISVKKGTDQTSEALANANEPAVDAGYQKLYSVLVPNAGSVSDAKIKRWAKQWQRHTETYAAVDGAYASMNIDGTYSSYLISTGAWVWTQGFRVKSGQSLVSVRVSVKQANGGSDPVTVQVWKRSGGTEELIAEKDGSAATGDITVVFDDDELIDFDAWPIGLSAGVQYGVNVVGTIANDRAYGFDVELDEAIGAA